MIGDNAQRARAIPFRANWFDSNATVGNQFIPGDTVTGDLDIIMTGQGNGGVVRFWRPAKGDIISARLTMNAVSSVNPPTLLRFIKGRFDTDGVTALPLTEANYPEAQRAADWLQITGFNEPLDYGSQDNVYIDGMNVLPLIPKRGDSDFNADGFVIGIELSTSEPETWALFDFRLDCLVRMAKP